MLIALSNMGGIATSSLRDLLIRICFLTVSELGHGQQSRFHAEHGTATDATIMPAQRFHIAHKTAYIVSHAFSSGRPDVTQTLWRYQETP